MVVGPADVIVRRSYRCSTANGYRRHTEAVVLAMGPVLAHQGGWDEILLVGAPLLILAGLLYLANKRANERAEQPTADTDA